MKSRLKRPRTRPTQAGGAFILIAGLVQLAAFTTGENLLYLLAAGVASLLILSALLTRLSLRRVVVDRHAPSTVERGALFRSEVHIVNRRRLFSVVSLQLTGGNLDGEDKRHVGSIASGESLPLWLGHRFEKRGIRKLARIGLNSGFPLGLFRTSRILDDGAEVVVLPRVHRLKPSALDQLEGAGEITRRAPGEGDEFFSLRDYLPGDDVRRIAWKVSARLGRYVVRELEPTVARNVRIFFDTRVPAGALGKDTGLSWDADEEFELAVDLAASLAVAFLDRRYAVSLVTRQGRVESGEGHTHAMRILKMLATIEAEPYSSEAWPAQHEESDGAAAVFVSANAAFWGARALGTRARILNPHEARYA